MHRRVGLWVGPYFLGAPGGRYVVCGQYIILNTFPAVRALWFFQIA